MDAPTDRATAFGQELVRAHDRLRETLDALRAAVTGGSPASLTRDLQAHCLAFCAAVTRHHTTEDELAFPALAHERPDLADVLAELTHDHELIAGVLQRVADIAADPASVPGAAGELDGLAAVLDSHFRWEERRLVGALDAARDLPSVTW